MCKLMEAPGAHNSDKQTVSRGFPSKIINTPPKVVFDDNGGQPREARGGHTRNKQTRADWLEQLREVQKCAAQAVQGNFQ